MNPRHVPIDDKPRNNSANLYDSLPLPPANTNAIHDKHVESPNIVKSIPDLPLSATKIETPRPAVKSGSPLMRDVFGLGAFVAIIIFGAFLINMFIFRSFNVVGPSMEPTLQGGIDEAPNDRLIVNRIPITIANITGKTYIPERGQIIVFKNPHWIRGQEDEYVVKRVIGLPGERVTVSDCELKVYNSENKNGFNPYKDFDNLASNDSEYNSCVDGDGTNVTVPEEEIFVVGDHRQSNYSMDSRNGGGRSSLGTVPLEEIVGPVTLRIWPLDQIKLF